MTVVTAFSDISCSIFQAGQAPRAWWGGSRAYSGGIAQDKLAGKQGGFLHGLVIGFGRIDAGQ